MIPNSTKISYEAATKSCYGWGSPQHEEPYWRVAALERLRTTALCQWWLQKCAGIKHCACIWQSVSPSALSWSSVQAKLSISKLKIPHTYSNVYVREQSWKSFPQISFYISFSQHSMVREMMLLIRCLWIDHHSVCNTQVLLRVSPPSSHCWSRDQPWDVKG